MTILEVVDLECPARQAHELQTQPTVIERLVRTGRANLQLQLVNFRDAPADTTDGEAARRAAYGLAARDRFWDVVHLTVWNQGSEQDAWVGEPLLWADRRRRPGRVLARGARTGTRVADASSVDALEQAVEEATRNAGAGSG